MSTCEEKQAYLKAAEDAWHQLQLTGGVILTRYGDKELRFSATNSNQLLRYINILRGQVAACTGCPDRGQQRAIRIVPRDSR